ncbi:hypothetical protein Tco_0991689 [Tanacetum coccineum]|uniref:Reverse transcriptase domain-containing protein n=1 Tax=Tanacetum coccineum TaxID=301880 RepID=A0ABQ5F096_9ASTR
MAFWCQEFLFGDRSADFWFTYLLEGTAHTAIKSRSSILGRIIRPNPVLAIERKTQQPSGNNRIRAKVNTDKIVQIRERLKAARDRQKSYADNRQKPLEFSVGDKVLLKVSPRKGVVRFGKRSKLSPNSGTVLRLSNETSSSLSVCCLRTIPSGSSSNTFHVSNLKKCLADVTLHAPLEEVKIDDKLHFVEEPMEIMDREVKKLKKRRIPIVKVRWNSRRGPEFTWEREDEMKRKYPQLFARYDLARATEISGRNSL